MSENTTSLWIEIANPDNPADMPIFTGSVEQASRTLTSGTYSGVVVGDENTPVRIIVGADSVSLLPGI